MGEAKRRKLEIEQMKQHTRSVPFGDYLLAPGFLLPSMRGLFEELQQEALELQPWRPGEFSRRAAAIHEASHCVVAAREGHVMKSARIFQSPLGGWIGDFELDRAGGFMSAEDPKFLAELRIMLAGRRGELLCFGNKFCLRAGLDELAWALVMIMPMLTVQADGDEKWTHELYGPTWETTLAEVDETLLAHISVIDAIADRLIRAGSLAGPELTQLVAPVPARASPPPIRAEHGLHGIAYDPLAYPPTDSRRSQYLRAIAEADHAEQAAKA
jgi:hypothetical protein